jgi:hypothetical protein
VNDGVQARRAAILRVLYAQRRDNPAAPRMTTQQVATGTNLSRQDTLFDLWVLTAQGLVRQANCGTVEITIAGALALETESRL